MNRILIIIPTYNEIENIGAIIPAVLDISAQYNVLIIDDNSPDGTADAVKKMIPQYENRLYIIERSGKLGLGTAYIKGFEYALEHYYDYIMEMDADFSHNPNSIDDIYKACQADGVGMAVGSRYVKGGGFVNWSKYRLFLSYGASIYTRLITGMTVKDATAGFVMYKKEVLQKMDLNKIEFVGYAFQIEMKYYCHSLGYNIAEVPITFVDRELGTSKMNSSIIKEAVLGVIKMRFRDYGS